MCSLAAGNGQWCWNCRSLWRLSMFFLCGLHSYGGSLYICDLRLMLHLLVHWLMDLPRLLNPHQDCIWRYWILWFSLLRCMIEDQWWGPWRISCLHYFPLRPCVAVPILRLFRNGVCDLYLCPPQACSQSCAELIKEFLRWGPLHGHWWKSVWRTERNLFLLIWWSNTIRFESILPTDIWKTLVVLSQWCLVLQFMNKCSQQSAGMLEMHVQLQATSNIPTFQGSDVTTATQLSNSNALQWFWIQ